MNKFIKAIPPVMIILSSLCACGYPTLPPSPTKTVFSSQPMPFDYISEIPVNTFLVTFLADDDYTCLDDLCGCAISEAPALPFEFVDDFLILNPLFYKLQTDALWETFRDNEDWVNLRKSNHSIGLHGFYSQWDSVWSLFSVFPYETGTDDISIVGANANGDIQIKTREGFSVIFAGSKAVMERQERMSLTCKVLHIYSFTNYGFIKDENVKFLQRR